jgi:hypothetical protein
MKATDNIPRAAVRLRLILIALFSLLLVFIFSLKRYPELVEKYYSQGLFPAIRKNVLVLLNYVPFSVGDIIYMIIIIGAISGFIYLIILLVKGKPKSAGFAFLGFILRLEIVITLFYVLWALNYFRQPSSKRLQLPDYQYNATELISITSMLVDSANYTRSVLNAGDLDLSKSEISKASVEAIQTLANFKPAQIAISPKPKSSILSPVLNYIGISGYYNPLTGEAQFNDEMPIYARPFVECHEMAHQMGFGAEDEANFAGFIAGKSSPNRLLKYSAYYLASQEFMAEVWRTDSTAFRQLKSKISPAVLHDLETERLYWTKYQGKAARLSSIFYDNYLKANNQPGGLKTYNRMIKLSMSYYRKKKGWLSPDFLFTF